MTLAPVSARLTGTACASVRSMAVRIPLRAFIASELPRSSSLARLGLGRIFGGGGRIELGFAAQPAQAFADRLLQALLRRLVEARAHEFVGQIALAGYEAALALRRVLIALAIAFVLHQARHGVAQLLRYRERAVLVDRGARRADRAFDRVRFGAAGQIQAGVRQGK